MSNIKINIDNFQIGGNQLVLIAGPCAIESEKLIMETAEFLLNLCSNLKIPLIFKSSFDKANRTSIDSFRGLGIDKGLYILRKVKETYNIPITTDIHLPEQAKAVSTVVDMLQIPAFLCRQTDLIVEAAKTNIPIDIKKAQFLSAQDMKNVIKKAEKVGNNKIALCERGTMFGYNNLVVDMTGIVEMKKFGYPIIFDATHSVQKPGGYGECTGGNREYAQYLAKAAVAVGVDAIFMEVHPNPDSALSDGANMIKLSNLEEILKSILDIYKVVN